MRIEFPNAARDDFHWAQAQLRVGSAPDNDLLLPAGQAAAQHLSIQQDRRGWVLHVLPSADRIHVNARPVREKALVRPGDVVSVGDCRMLLRSDEDPASRAELRVAQEQRCIVGLRAVAGPLSGHVLTVNDSLELSPHGDRALELPQDNTVALRVFRQNGQLWLET